MALSPGSKLGPYEVLSLLGAGGMGEVYRARDPRLGREVAIKVLPAERMADENRRRRFVQEARAASALSHPNIVTIHEIESADGVDFIEDRPRWGCLLHLEPSPKVSTIKTPVKIGEGGFMLWTIVVILVILWLLGALGTVSLPVLSGNTVHVLLVIVIVIVVLQLLQRRRF